MRGVCFSLSLALAVCVLSLGAAASAADAQPTNTQIYWGATIDGHAYGFGSTPGDMRGVQTFETNTGKRVSIISFGSSWMNGSGQFNAFNTSNFEKVRLHGSIPLFTWQTNGPNKADFQNLIVANGRYDSYIHSWARAAKAWGHPFFLRFDHEMDGSWFPWGEGRKVPGGPIANGNTPGSFVQMWRHVHDIFSQEGATNITWVWNVNQENLIGRYPPLSQIYPGDAYVDWTGIDAYNRYPDHWQTFDAMFTGRNNPLLEPTANTYQLVLNVAPTKPMLIGEIGAIELPTDPTAKGLWFRDALITQLVRNFTAFGAILYFNVGSDNPTVPIESSEFGRAAFANSIALSTYTTNTFTSLPAGKIAPPTTPVAYLAPVADTYIASDSRTSTAGGTATSLVIKGDPSVTRKAFMRFDLSSLAGRTIDQAVLQVSTITASGAQSNGTFNIRLDTNNAWTEALMSWNNNGGSQSFAGAPVATLVSPDHAGTAYLAKLPTSLIARRAGGLLSLEMDTSSTDAVVIYSRETSRVASRPQLVVAYH
jgi:Glycosyl hydrolase family 26